MAVNMRAVEIRKDTIFPCLVSDYYFAFKKFRSEPYFASLVDGNSCANQQNNCVDSCCALDQELLRTVVRPLKESFFQILNQAEIDYYIASLKKCPKDQVPCESPIDVLFGLKTEYTYSREFFCVYISKLLIMAIFTMKYQENQKLLDELVDIFAYKNNPPADKIRGHLSGKLLGMDSDGWSILLDQSIFMYKKCGMPYNSDLFGQLYNPKKNEKITDFLF